MAEMKNPNQQTGRESMRATIAMALVMFVALFWWHTSQQRMYVAPKETQTAAIAHTSAYEGGFTKKLQIVEPVQAPASHVEFPDKLAWPFIVALRWIQRHVVPNWGWAILLLTLSINMGLLPIRIKAMRSQLKMQQIQPEIAAIKEKFKGCSFGDARMQAMNAEIGALQKSHGVSVFGGMLPLLVQWLLLYGVYRMLHGAVDLHHAPWLWLHDLSAADPLHILPVFFLLTMILQQIITPAPGTDAAQRKMMAVVLPAIYGWMTWHVSAGLALYWSFGNALAIVQQIVFNQTRSAREARDVAKRRRLTATSVGA